jgi:hypothetical protein
MIKRSPRNIGKFVLISEHSQFNNHTGMVKGFRGDFEKGNPFVEVWIYSQRSIWPIRGSSLTAIPYTPKDKL